MNYNKENLENGKTIYFKGIKLSEMIDSFELIDVSDNKRKRKDDEFFFSFKGLDRKENFYGYLKLKKEFKKLWSDTIFKDRFENAHFEFIEWINDRVLGVGNDGLYISSSWINFFDKEELVSFFNKREISEYLKEYKKAMKKLN